MRTIKAIMIPMLIVSTLMFQNTLAAQLTLQCPSFQKLVAFSVTEPTFIGDEQWLVEPFSSPKKEDPQELFNQSVKQAQQYSSVSAMISNDVPGLGVNVQISCDFPRSDSAGKLTIVGAAGTSVKNCKFNDNQNLNATTWVYCENPNNCIITCDE
ncbi:MAG: hypothetical protein KIT27_00740 [Legionellales bacterium]|nr:hypothetical protein [Legionellales bacterium]